MEVIDIVDLLIDLIALMVQVFTIAYVVVNISFIKLTIKNILILITLLSMFGLFVMYYKSEFLMIPIISMVIIIFLYFISKEVFNSIIVSIFPVLTAVLADALAGFILIFILKINYYEIRDNNQFKILPYLFLPPVGFVISKFSKKYIKKIYIKKKFKIGTKNNILLVLSIILSAISFYSYLLMFKFSFNLSNNKVCLLNFLLAGSFVVSSILIIYYNINNKKNDVEKKYINREIVQLKEYTSTIEQISLNFRSFKHDSLNILQVIGEFIKNKDLEGLEEFYSNALMPETKKTLVRDGSCFMLLQHLKIDPLKGLISSKIITAQSKDIETRIELIEDINSLPISNLDICRIVGILLDNAIEEAILSENKKIYLAIIKNEEMATIVVSNSCSKEASIDKIYTKDFTTKGMSRGIGLKIIKQIINEKYPNILLNTKIKDSIFSQELVLFE